MKYSFDNIPTSFGNWQLGPLGVGQLAQAQGQLMANSYLPSIMRSMGFDDGGDGIRQLLQQDTRHADAMKLAQDAEADGDTVTWRVGSDGVPTRSAYGQMPYGQYISGRKAAEIFRRRAAAYAPPATQQPQQPAYGKPMSMAEFWGQR